MTRILMISQRYKPAIGGVENHVSKISELLSGMGFEVTVLTSSHMAGLKSHELIRRVRIMRIPHGWENNPVIVWLWIIWHRNELDGFDMVHIHDTVPFLFWYLPLRMLRANHRICTTFHGFESDPVSVVFRIMRKLVSRLSWRTICIGSYIEREYRLHCDACTLGGADTKEIVKRNGEGLVFVGRLEPDTGVLAYLDVLRILKEKHNIETHLTVCGGGALEKELALRARSNHRDLRMKGIVGNPEQFIGSARVCLAGGYLSILHSLYIGTPVVALALTPLKMRYFLSMKNEGAPVSIQSSSEGVAREISRLLKNPQLYLLISRAGKEFASQHTWQIVVQKYLELWTCK